MRGRTASRLVLISFLFYSSMFVTAEAAAVEYEFLFQWGQTGEPEALLSRPQGIAIGPAGQVYVTDHPHKALKIYSASGEYIKSFPIAGCNTMGIEVDSAGRIFVLERDYSCWDDIVHVYDSNGLHLGSWGAGSYSNSGDNYFWNPEDLAIGPDGFLHITDTYNDRIKVYDVSFSDSKGDGVEEATASLVRVWGSYGTAPGQFDTPGGIAFDSTGLVYVSDEWGQRIQIFDAISEPPGTYPLNTWGQPEPVNPPLTDNGLFVPRDVEIGPDGHVFVVDAFHHRVIVFDPSGNAVETVGAEGAGEGQFYYPNSLAVSPAGLLYVTDPNHDRVEVFGPVAEATPSELIVELLTAISLGDFPNAVAKAGTKKLQLAERFIQRDQINSAINQLFVFQEIVQNQIDDGKLNPIDGYELIAAAQKIVEAITAGS